MPGARRLLRPVARWLRVHYAARVGNAGAREARRHLARAPRTVEAAVEAILARWGPETVGAPPDEPVFVLAARGRSGSTWLQRLVMSSNEILVWGEPYAHSGLVPKLAGQLVPLSPSWPPPHTFAAEGAARALADQWVAVLNPPLSDLALAGRSSPLRSGA